MEPHHDDDNVPAIDDFAGADGGSGHAGSEDAHTAIEEK
jgi:hypothetical protein